MKDAARLLAYFAATLLFGALAAPPLYWSAQHFSGIIPSLAAFDFETFFHRALLAGALLFLWPLLRWLRIRSARDLGPIRNPRAVRDLGLGVLFAALPLMLFAALVLSLGVYSLRSEVSLGVLASRALSAGVVPFIEEPIFRGLILGVLLRSNRRPVAIGLSAAVFSILHFLKAPENTTNIVTWSSGFVSLAHAFAQFTDPLLVAAGFTTLFLLGWILADARIRTNSLWLPIGLHAGWIFTSAIFNKIAHRESLALPWLGKSLLVGLGPLGVALITWALVRAWLRYVETRKT